MKNNIKALKAIYYDNCCRSLAKSKDLSFKKGFNGAKEVCLVIEFIEEREV